MRTFLHKKCNALSVQNQNADNLDKKIRVNVNIPCVYPGKMIISQESK